MKCVSAYNPGSSSNVVAPYFTNIPYTSNVTYLVVAWSYTNGNFNVGTYYDLTGNQYSSHYSPTIFIDENGNVTNIGFSGGGSWVLNGTTLQNSTGSRYENWALFVLEYNGQSGSGTSGGIDGLSSIGIDPYRDTSGSISFTADRTGLLICHSTHHGAAYNLANYPPSVTINGTTSTVSFSHSYNPPYNSLVSYSIPVTVGDSVTYTLNSGLASLGSTYNITTCSLVGV